MIVGTQTDLREDASVREKLAKQRMQPVKKEDGERMAKDLGAVKYVECSALTQYKLKDVFDEVRFIHAPCPSQPCCSATSKSIGKDLLLGLTVLTKQSRRLWRPLSLLLSPKTEAEEGIGHA